MLLFKLVVILSTYRWILVYIRKSIIIDYTNSLEKSKKRKKKGEAKPASKTGKYSKLTMSIQYCIYKDYLYLMCKLEFKDKQSKLGLESKTLASLKYASKTGKH